jgi:hypothetical protein
MSLVSVFIGFMMGALTIFVAGSLWFFGLIDSGRLMRR